jgi:hypothetical protein
MPEAAEPLCADEHDRIRRQPGSSVERVQLLRHAYEQVLPRYLTIRRQPLMSRSRLRSMTTALTAPPFWPILTRRSTAVSDEETVSGP